MPEERRMRSAASPRDSFIRKYKNPAPRSTTSAETTMRITKPVDAAKDSSVATAVLKTIVPVGLGMGDDVGADLGWSVGG